MKIVHFLLLFLCPLISFAQEGSNSDSTTYVNQKVSKEDLIFLNSEHDYAELKLNFKRIGEETFLDHKYNYDSKISYDDSKIRETPFSFFLNTNVGEFQFRYKKEFGDAKYRYYSYLGFLKPLGFYLIHSESRLYEDVVGLDIATGKKLKLFSTYKNQNIGICISNNDKQLLFFAASKDDDIESEIAIYNLERKTFKKFSTEDWNIDELFWISKNSFVLKAFKTNKYNQSRGKFVMTGIQFLKVTIAK